MMFIVISSMAQSHMREYTWVI